MDTTEKILKQEFQQLEAWSTGKKRKRQESIREHKDNEFWVLDRPPGMAGTSLHGLSMIAQAVVVFIFICELHIACSLHGAFRRDRLNAVTDVDQHLCGSL